ncbi:ATP-binding protein [Microtetraspora niveoalba]|uniref:ATP-binding protein n=1 Tax=Microtetraspora niveoalba TaxID=46175 RepID=UPI00083580C5|nr:ATP-binding protein [Microtetraspora niveoalba]
MDIPAKLSDGGFPAWSLPLDATCAEFARSVARALCQEFGLARDIVDDVTLIASELATNALLHAYRTERTPPGTGRPEMWAYLRRCSVPEIVVKVVDPVPWKGPFRRPPQSPPTDSTGGRGLHLVDALTAEHGGRWGVHPTRARLGASPYPGKAVFFTVPVSARTTELVPETATARRRPWACRRSAERIHALLTARGLRADLTGDGTLLHEGGGWQVRVREEWISYRLLGGEAVRLPASEGIEVVERIVRHTEELVAVCSRMALPL